MDLGCCIQVIFTHYLQFTRPIITIRTAITAMTLYHRHVFKDGGFGLRENDYVFRDQKFGGNAQYFTGQRWLHHTSFLWNYKPESIRNAGVGSSDDAEGNEYVVP